MNTDRFNDDNGRAGVPDELEIRADEFAEFKDHPNVQRVLDNDGCKVKDVYQIRGGYYKRIQDGIGYVSRPSAANEVLTVVFKY